MTRALLRFDAGPAKPMQHSSARPCPGPILASEITSVPTSQREANKARLLQRTLGVANPAWPASSAPNRQGARGRAAL
jgi:hypothetical protein